MKLLQRLLPSHDVDALLGDIAEESRHRSRLWFWAQLAAVVISGSWKDVRQHKGLALRATLTGLLVLPVFFLPASLVIQAARVLSEGGYYVGPYWLTLPHTALIVAPLLVNTTGFGVSGWVVARFSRAHGVAMVLPYLLVVSLLPAAATLRLLVNAAGREFSPSPPLVAAELSILLLPVFAALGAVLGLRWNRT